MTEKYSLWERLQKHDKPIIMYGTGNGADKIISALDSYSVKLDGIFASEGFVRERYFHGYKVLSYSEMLSQYGDDFTVLLAFGTNRAEMYEVIEELDKKHELIIPDVPLYGGKIFDMHYFRAHEKELLNIRKLLSDEKSQIIFDYAVNFRLTGKLEYLKNTDTLPCQLSDVFHGTEITSVLDGGAFKGDSTEDFISALNPSKVYAVEADPKTFLKLSAYAEHETRAEIIPVNSILSDTVGERIYVSSASRGSGIDGRNKRAKEATVRCETIDSILGGSDIDLVKLDIEGDELAALQGAEYTLSRYKPNLSVSLYHRTDDIFTLPEYVHSVLPEHKLYLRRTPCIPFWDLNLYAVR